MTSVKILKIHKWWSSHYGMMMAFVALVVAIGPSPPPIGTLLATLGLFTLASLGIGSFGQLLNDLADVEQDLRSGAQNLVARRGPLVRAAIFTAALAVGIIPWWWLPTTPAIAALVAAEYVLFALYSLPPIRLKDRGLLGPVADALYGYVVPNAVAVLLFAGLVGGVPGWFVAVLVAWTFLYGLEQILYHQFCDESRDRRDGIRTFVVVRGWDGAFKFLHRVVVPLEALAFVALLVGVGRFAPLIPAAFAVSVAVLFVTWSRRSLANTARLDRLPAIDGVNLVAWMAIARFVQTWLPFLAMLTLVTTHPQYLALLVPQLVLFPAPILWLRWIGLPAARRLLGPA